MTAQRARAYARVMQLLRDVGPAKLLPAEQSRIRFATDSLLFCADLLTDPAARGTCSDIYSLRDQLVASGRWSAVRADALVDDVMACGPTLSATLPLAA